MNVVSFETAVKLKEAGFPQPKPERGQMWWKVEDVDEYELLVIDEYRFTHVTVDGKFGEEIILKEDFEGLAYMPTVTDILRELGENYTLHAPGADGKWLVMCDLAGYEHENPAEAAAPAWLATRHT